MIQWKTMNWFIQTCECRTLVQYTTRSAQLTKLKKIPYIRSGFQLSTNDSSAFEHYNLILLIMMVIISIKVFAVSTWSTQKKLQTSADNGGGTYLCKGSLLWHPSSCDLCIDRFVVAWAAVENKYINYRGVGVGWLTGGNYTTPQIVWLAQIKFKMQQYSCSIFYLYSYACTHAKTKNTRHMHMFQSWEKGR